MESPRRRANGFAVVGIILRDWNCWLKHALGFAIAMPNKNERALPEEDTTSTHYRARFWRRVSALPDRLQRQTGSSLNRCRFENLDAFQLFRAEFGSLSVR